MALAASVFLFSSAAEARTWRSCPTNARTATGYESYLKASRLRAQAPMNCASARYAFGIAWNRIRASGWPLPRRINDGYVVWHRTGLRRVAGTPGSGCGWARWVVTYREFTTGTAFRFRLYGSGC
jgi:hypothetical protein